MRQLQRTASWVLAVCACVIFVNMIFHQPCCWGSKVNIQSYCDFIHPIPNTMRKCLDHLNLEECLGHKTTRLCFSLYLLVELMDPLWSPVSSNSRNKQNQECKKVFKALNVFFLLSFVGPTNSHINTNTGVVWRWNYKKKAICCNKGVEEHRREMAHYHWYTAQQLSAVRAVNTSLLACIIH